MLKYSNFPSFAKASKMAELAVQLEDELVSTIDALVKEGRFSSRSEAIEAAVKGMIRNELAERVRRLLDQAVDEIVSIRKYGR
jgi:Arc/MetJ-type ribon-helix-helix transcriptional regulator